MLSGYLMAGRHEGIRDPFGNHLRIVQLADAPQAAASSSGRRPWH
jgi:hypothetical protein